MQGRADTTLLVPPNVINSYAIPKDSMIIDVIMFHGVVVHCHHAHVLTLSLRKLTNAAGTKK